MHLSLFTLLSLISLLPFSYASVTVYSQKPIHTGVPAHDPTILQAPPIPNPPPATQFTLLLQQQAQAVQGLSIQQSGSFMGFSIETSVVNQVRE